MSRLLRIYFNALFGGLGGLIGWMLFADLVSEDWARGVLKTVFDGESTGRLGQGLVDIVGGALVGAMIGYFVVSVDAILDRVLIRFCRYAAYGVVLGAAGGAIGYLVGDLINEGLLNLLLMINKDEKPAAFLQFAMTVVARGLGFLFLGLAVGASGGIASKSLGKLWYGTIGGTIGGFLGGAIFGLLIAAAQASGTLDKNSPIYTWGAAIGLVILGACIGGLIALVEEVFKPAALKVMRGWQEGREYPLIKPASVVGRDEGVDILLLRDMKVERKHAVIHRRGERFVLVNNQAPAEQTLVNGDPVVQSVELKDGDRIQLGNVVLRFLMRAAVERKRRAPPSVGSISALTR